MGTISDKLTYLNTTKTQLRTMLQYANQNITSSTTFRAYVSGLFQAYINILNTPENVFSMLPKITTTPSTSQSINNTIEAPMRIMLNATELTQDGTPTPSSPQDIHTISGDNTISVCGKNVFKGINYTDTNISSGVLTLDATNNYLTGKSTGAWANYMMIIKNDKPNTNYNLSCTFLETSATHNIRLSAYGCDDTSGTTSSTLNAGTSSEIALNTDTRINISYTSDNSPYIMLRFWWNSGATNITTNMTIKDIQLELGSTPTTYEAYNGTDYSVDLGYENLLDIQNQTISSGAGIEELNNNYFITIPKTTTYERVIWFENIKLKTNTTYTITKTMELLSGTLPSICGQLELYNGGTWIKVIQSASSTSSTFNVSADGTYRIRLKCTDSNYSTDYKVKFSNIMLYEGTTAKTYTPYGKAIDYSKISTYEDKFIRTSGKNLFDDSVEVKNAYPSTTVGSTVSYTNSTATISYVNGAYVEANKTYTISWDQSTTASATSTRVGVIVDSSNKVLQTQNTWINGTTSITFTPTNSGYLIVCADKNATLYQLEVRSSKTDYEPYGSNEWYIKKNIGKVVLDGTENWSIYNSNIYLYDDTFILSEGQNNYFPTNFKADHFTPNSLTNAYANPNASYMIQNVWGVRDRQRGVAIEINDTFTDLATWKTWLSNNNTIVYYQLATPTYTQITGTLETQLESLYNAQSKNGQTNISQVNNDLSFVLNVSAIEDLEV